MTRNALRMSRGRLVPFLAVSATGLGALLNLSASDAQEPHGSLQQEIAQVEQQVDSIEADTLAMIASLPPGGAHKPAILGKALFFDKNLSVNRNEACAFCHMPQTGFQGAIESLNLGAVAQPGSVRTRFSLRKPPSAAYAPFSPPLIYAVISGTCVRPACGCRIPPPCRRKDHPSTRRRWPIPIQPASSIGWPRDLIRAFSNAYGDRTHLL